MTAPVTTTLFEVCKCCSASPCDEPHVGGDEHGGREHDEQHRHDQQRHDTQRWYLYYRKKWHVHVLEGRDGNNGQDVEDDPPASAAGGVVVVQLM